MRKVVPIALVFVVVLGALSVAQRPTTQPNPAAAEVSRRFLQHLQNKKIDEALQLWDSKDSPDRQRERFEKMAAKINSFGGIKRIDVGDCEPRRAANYEQQRGEKADFIPMEIIMKDDNLLLAVFSVRNVKGVPKIFHLESLKEWGGTASLDEERGYQL